MKECIWVDIDGTISNGDHRLNHISGEKKDYETFYQESINDSPYQDMIDLITLLADYGMAIVVCTGRPEHTRDVTTAWLRKQLVFYEALYMRTDNDFRHDDIIKLELLAKMRADGYEPWFALEDRNRVVDALRTAGVRVLHVREGNY